MPASARFGCPFDLIVPREEIESELRRRGIRWRDRLLDPATTLYAWMGQIASQDRSCRHAVSRLAAFHSETGHPVSARTGSYTAARQRLDLGTIQALSRRVARDLEDANSQHWFLSRPALAVDGTFISSADTASIQQEYPQHGQMAPGIGFPMLRVVLLFSIATGAVMDIVVAAMTGENTGELAMFRETWDQLRTGDVVVGDRLYYSWPHMYLLGERGIHLLCRKPDKLKLRGRPVLRVLGRHDHLHRLWRPHRPPWMSKQQFAQTPDAILVRMTSRRIGSEGRDKRLDLVTTIRDSAVDADALAELYRLRWNAELDIRSFKLDLHADILSCKTAEMIRKELWVTALAYNAVRAIMARAAASTGVAPRSLSVKGAMQAIDAFSPRLDRVHSADRDAVVAQMLAAISSQMVANRPGRVEPRLVKRRRKPINLMTVPRDEARSRCRGGRYE
jgi:Transposase DDE domain